MAVTPTTREFCCIKVQQMLEDIVGANTPEFLRQETNGFMMALTSQQNTGGFAQVQSTFGNSGKGPANGGNAKVDVEYRKRTCTTSVDTVPGLCDDAAATPSDIIASTVTVECVKSQEFWLDKESYRQLCESPSDMQANLFRDKIADLKRDINDDLISKFATGFGNYYTKPGDVPVDSGTNPKTLLLFDSTPAAGIRTNGLAMTPLMADYRKSGFRSSPIVVGGDLFARYMEAQNLFVGNVEGGDATRMPSFASWVDYAINPVLGGATEELLSWVPGYVQMLEWYQFPAGSVYEELKEDYQETVMSMGDFTFDFSVRYDECNRKWHFVMTKYYDLFKIPGEAFNTVAPCNQQSNGCLQWLADCGTVECNYTKL